MAMKDRGFASLSVERRRQIARMGGLAAHAKGTAHEWTSEEARKAGAKGGSKSKRRVTQPAMMTEPVPATV